MLSMKLARIAALSAALTVPAFLGAVADTSSGPFDGQWIVDVPPSPLIAESSDAVCPALRLPLRIEGGQVVGELTRVPSRTGTLMVEMGNGTDAAPVTGKIDPDGTVHASWENYHATGKLSGDNGQITVQTECGPAIASATRVSR